jgi:hypothetical protein
MCSYVGMVLYACQNGGPRIAAAVDLPNVQSSFEKAEESVTPQSLRLLCLWGAIVDWCLLIRNLALDAIFCSAFEREIEGILAELSKLVYACVRIEVLHLRAYLLGRGSYSASDELISSCVPSISSR